MKVTRESLERLKNNHPEIYRLVAAQEYLGAVDEIFRLKDAAAELFSFIEEHADKRFLHHATALAEFRKRLLG